MAASEHIISVPTLQDDPRIRIFRRTFPPMEECAGMHVDAYVIVTERFVVICDTLLCPADMAFVMEQVRPVLSTGRQLLVLNSHADWDHTWGNSYFTGKNSAPLLAQQHSRVRMRSAEALAELVAYQKRDALFQQVVLVAPTLTFTHGLTLYGGDLTLELFPAPGHSSDSSALWIPELRLLLAFDSLEAPLPLIESAQSVQPFIRTLQRFLSLQPEHVLCSHSKTAGVALVYNNLTYLQKLVQRCRTLLLTHRPTDAELEHPSKLIASPFTEFGDEGEETPAAAFYRQAHEENVRFILQGVMDHWVE